MEDVVQTLTRGNVTKVKVVLASVATALVAELDSREERLEERNDARDERIEQRNED